MSSRVVIESRFDSSGRLIRKAKLRSGAPLEGIDMTGIREIGGPSSWMGPDLQDSDEWILELEETHAQELLRALSAVETAGLDFLELTRANFALPTVGPLLQSLLEILLEGRGFVLLRGTPVDGLTERQIELMYWGMGLYVGIALPQGATGTDLFAHVRDEGADRHANYGGGLLNKHSGGLPFHTDSSDIVGLLCIHPALRGGASTIVSTVAVHDEIVRRRPDLAGVMYQPWWFDRKRGDGPDSFAQCPIYAVNDAGQLFAFYGPDLYKTAVRGEFVPDLTPQQLEAMALIDEINASPDFQLHMNFQPGEIQFINNYAVMHSRTAYEDHPDPALRRDLIRLWLTIDRELDIPASFNERGLTARSTAFAR